MSGANISKFTPPKLPSRFGPFADAELSPESRKDKVSNIASLRFLFVSFTTFNHHEL